MTEEPREPTPEELEVERLQKLQDEVGRAAGDAQFEEPPDVSHIEDMVRQRRAAVSAAKQKKETEQADSQKANRGLGIGMTIAWVIIITPMIGLGLGWLVDRGTNSNVFSLIGFVLGGALAIAYAVRASARA